MKHINVTVTGRVQGVYFRASTKGVADSLCVSGFVRNQRNGNVYLEAEGEEEDIQQLLDWLEVGPAAARVNSLVVGEGEFVHMEGFVVRR